MRLRLVSDIQLESYDAGNNPVLDSLCSASRQGVDGIILAGDIDTICTQLENDGQLNKYFLSLIEGYKYKFYVFGNREFYGSRFGPKNSIRSVLSEYGVYVLDNSYFVIENKVIFGGTGWFPDRPDNLFYQREIQDFSMIDGLHGAYIWHETFKRMLLSMTLLNRPVDLVISHHIPFDNLIDEKYQDSKLNRFDSMSLDSMFQESKHNGLPVINNWVYGHTYTNRDIILGGTRFVCNPMGTPREGYNQGFIENLVIDI